MLASLRHLSARLPRLRAAYWGTRRACDRLAGRFAAMMLRGSRRRLPASAEPQLIVSLTSFPARIDNVWIPIESVLRQDHPPDRVVLVLSDEEFPSRELPPKLIEQQRRGLEILWTPRNDRSFNKLIPTRRKYPGATIVTVDDDVRYARWLVARLAAHARAHPGVVIGLRGWEVAGDVDRLAPYESWGLASPSTPSERVLLTGVGGVLYPPDVLPIDLLLDVELAKTVCPTNDDIWFWAVERAAGVPVVCLSLDACRSLGRPSSGARLKQTNWAQNDAQLACAVEQFGLRL